MNIIVIILVVFAVLGLVDKAIGGKMGLAGEIDVGLSTMGTCAVYIVGIYSIGVTFIENNSESIVRMTDAFPMDPSIMIGCILAPDLGGLPIAMGVTSDKAMGYFSGIIIGACLGQFISFQLPVVYNMLDSYTKQKMIRGFIFGISAVPLGLIAGGLVMGINIVTLILNTSIIIAVCLMLLAGFIKAPAITEKFLISISKIIKVVCHGLFVIVVIGLFIPKISIVPNEVVFDSLYLILRMIIIVCGGLVLAKIIIRFSGKILEKIGRALKTDTLSIVGLMLNVINTLAIVPLFKDMDDNGKTINAAFSVSGSYALGGQMAFVLLVAPANVFAAFIVSKLTAGIVSVAIAVWVIRRPKKETLIEKIPA